MRNLFGWIKTMWNICSVVEKKIGILEIIYGVDTSHDVLLMHSQSDGNIRRNHKRQQRKWKTERNNPKSKVKNTTITQSDRDNYFIRTKDKVDKIFPYYLHFFLFVNNKTGFDSDKDIIRSPSKQMQHDPFGIRPFGLMSSIIMENELLCTNLKWHFKDSHRCIFENKLKWTKKKGDFEITQFDRRGDRY